MSEVDANPLYGIRASRADPPGLAKNGERRAVYGTALTQFEELIAAAEMASARTRPLSLFYALSQAGRAIAAVHLPDDWQLRGHGLTALDLGETDITKVKVAPNPGKGTSSFFGVAAATGSEPLFDSVGLVELWSSLPRVCELLPEADRKYRMPLGVSLLQRHVARMHTDDWKWVRAAAAPLLPGNLSEVEATLAAYRQGRTARLLDVQGLKPIRAITEHGEGVELRWPNPGRDYLGQHAPGYNGGASGACT